MMTLYYRDDTVQVSSEWIRVDGQAVRVADVTRVWHLRSRTGVAVRSRVFGRAVLVLLLSAPPLVALVCVVSLVYDVRARSDWRPALVALGLGVVVTLLLAPLLEWPLGWLDRSYDRGSRVRELWVRVRNEDVLLLRSSDGLRFGQIYRAVQRAVEQQGPYRA